MQGLGYGCSSLGLCLAVKVASHVVMSTTRFHWHWFSPRRFRLTTVEQMQLPFDVAFFVAHREQEIRRQAKAARDSDIVTVEALMKFDAQKVRAVRAVLRAREHQATFWAELNHESPSLMRLDEIGAAIQRNMEEANAGFEKMLHLNPNSVSALRDYAQFLSEVRVAKERSLLYQRRQQPPFVVVVVYRFLFPNGHGYLLY